MIKTRRGFLIAVFVLAFLIRLAAVLALRNPMEFHGPGPMGADAVDFNQYALNMVAGNGYCFTPGQPTSFRAPGFPFLLAAIYFFSPANYLAVYLMLCLMGAFTCVLTYYLAREVLNERQSRWAAVLSIFYFPHIYYSTVFVTEVLFALFLAAGLCCFLRYLKTDSAAQAALAGALLGYAALTRPQNLMLLPPLVLLLAWTRWRPRAAQVWRATLFLGLFAAVNVPWTIRNYVVHHKLVINVTNAGSGFYSGNNNRVLNEPDLWGYWIATTELPHRKLIDAQPDEVSHERMEWKLGWEWVSTHLSSMPRLMVMKFCRFWAPDVSSANKKYLLGAVVGYLPYCLLLLVGFFAHVRDRRYWTAEWMSLHAVIWVNVLLALIFYGHPRYRDDNTPVLMVYAALGLSVILSKFGGRRPAEGLRGE